MVNQEGFCAMDPFSLLSCTWNWAETFPLPSPGIILFGRLLITCILGGNPPALGHVYVCFADTAPPYSVSARSSHLIRLQYVSGVHSR